MDYLITLVDTVATLVLYRFHPARVQKLADLIGRNNLSNVKYVTVLIVAQGVPIHHFIVLQTLRITSYGQTHIYNQ